MRDVFKELIESRAKNLPYSLYSVCSSNAFVLETTIRRVARTGIPVLIEATANQVNQDGGYTGMKPAEFAATVEAIRKRYGADSDLVILGGDHLGPYPWREMEADRAMEAAERLVREFVAAGARKIHLDASMNLGGDTGPFPEPAVVAARAARLCAAAEDEHNQAQIRGVHRPPPVYVIGTEVPVPGGVVGEAEPGEIEERGGPRPTRSESLRQTLDVHEKAFASAGLLDAWRRVLAVVVQPGVEFESATVHPYRRERAAELKETIAARPGIFFEGHSTDYQSDEALRALTEDGFAFLKVGPALTFALREALVGLSHVESELRQSSKNRIEESLYATMKRNKAYWKDYYPRNERLTLLFSLSDRVRYYWDSAKMRSAQERLFSALKDRQLLPGLISQYLPRFAGPHNVVARPIPTDPRELAMAAVDAELARYEAACFPAGER